MGTIADMLIQSLAKTEKYSESNLKSSSINSSWIEAYEYRKDTKTLVMHTLSGKSYGWSNISKEIADQIIAGAASCKTNDKFGRWWIGKFPSLGAAYHQFLKIRGPGMLIEDLEPTLDPIGALTPREERTGLFVKTDAKTKSSSDMNYYIDPRLDFFLLPEIKTKKKVRRITLQEFLREFKSKLKNL